MKVRVTRVTQIIRSVELAPKDWQAFFTAEGIEVGREDTLVIAVKEGDREDEIRALPLENTTIVLTVKRTTRREEK